MVGWQKYWRIRFQRVRFTQNTWKIQNQRPKFFQSKPEMCNKTIVLVVFVIFDWSNLLNSTIVNGQLDHQESKSAKKIVIG